MARLFSGNEFAWGVSRCSGSVPTVTAGSAIAAFRAASQCVVSNGAVPTVATSRVRKDEMTIATGSGSIGAVVESETA
ncbi:MAG: hypothetical protein ACLQVM_23235 [Terriglobia bacterium]